MASYGAPVHRACTARIVRHRRVRISAAQTHPLHHGISARARTHGTLAARTERNCHCARDTPACSAHSAHVRAYYAAIM